MFNEVKKPSVDDRHPEKVKLKRLGTTTASHSLHQRIEIAVEQYVDCSQPQGHEYVREDQWDLQQHDSVFEIVQKR